MAVFFQVFCASLGENLCTQDLKDLVGVTKIGVCHLDNAAQVVESRQRLLNYIVPDFVHVLSEGRIVKSGGKELALELEEKGYVWLEADRAPSPAGAR